MFEAGAIAIRVDKARVCPLLFDVKKAELKWALFLVPKLPARCRVASYCASKIISPL